LIGVLLKSAEIGLVEEFFQLFKTPWEFFQADKRYDVIISDDPKAFCFDCKLAVILARERKRIEEPESLVPSKIVVLETGKVSFPIYCGMICIDSGQPVISRKSDRKNAAVLEREGCKIIMRIGFNFFAEVRYLLQNGQPVEFAEFPTLDIHINNLREWVISAGVVLVEIPPKPVGGKFFACLTHDVDNAGIKNHRCDRTVAGFIYRAVILSVLRLLKRKYSIQMLIRNWKAVVALPFIHLGLAQDYWCSFKKYAEIESGEDSTFFLVPFKGKAGKLVDGNAPSIRAVQYDVRDLTEEIKFLLDQGKELGVHGIDSWVDGKAGKKEVEKIQELTRKSSVGVRMHWLYFMPESYAIIENAGYAYDSTCGYNECVGFKAGTLQVFRPPGTENLLELPMHIMDTALFYLDRMNLSFSEGIKKVNSFIEKASYFGGVLTINWHDRSIAPERLWDGVYRDAVEELRARDAKFMTAGAVVDWFRKRREIVFERVECIDSKLKISLSFKALKTLDDFILRVWLPHGQSGGSHYRDTPIGEQNNFEFSFLNLS
jgi:hypothetical protein